MRISLVERFPDKKEAHGPIPCAPTEMDFSDRRGWRSPRPPPRRALQSHVPYGTWQSPVYIPKKAADYLKSSPSRLFWRRMIILRHYVSHARFLLFRKNRKSNPRRSASLHSSGETELPIQYLLGFLQISPIFRTL